jgi:hypothetical protein
MSKRAKFGHAIKAGIFGFVHHKPLGAAEFASFEVGNNKNCSGESVDG